MVDLIDTRTPYGFLIYFRNDVHTVMQAAGDRADCIAYLMGNHVIAERMFRHDPRAMLYAPLHTVIWEDAGGEAWFIVDQPSTQFSSLGIPAIDAVGLELDRKLARLLDVLDIEAPTALTRSTAPSRSPTTSMRSSGAANDADRLARHVSRIPKGEQ